MRRYLRYVLKNVEPIRIADDSTSQSGQTMTLKFIPGTTIRGLVVNALSRGKEFDEIRQALFSSDVRYLNAYVSREGKELFPSPKGFYEDKSEAQGKKRIENVVVEGAFREGLKRAALGRYARIEEDTVRYYGVETGSDLKIKINVSEEEQNVFRNEYITAGHFFTGYIVVEKPELEEAVRGVFDKTVILGNARSAGFGKCRVVSAEYVDKIPYGELLPGTDRKGSCYMMLLSNLAMRDENGEICGMNLKQLEKRMGVEQLSVKYCSTSTVDVRGYNRTWGIHTPSVTMYEQGSVFHLVYEGTFSAERMAAIADSGIGIRKNEGFGRVIFLDQYEKVMWKARGEEIPEGKSAPAAGGSAEACGEDAEVLKLTAGNYYRNLIRRKMREYVVDHPLQKGALGSSQLGKLEAFTTAYKYDPAAGKKAIEQYFDHAEKKEANRKTQKARGSIKGLVREVRKVFDADLNGLLGLETGDTIMGVDIKELLTEEDVYKLKMKLLTELIRYDNKKEGAR